MANSAIVYADNYDRPSMNESRTAVRLGCDKVLPYVCIMSFPVLSYYESAGTCVFSYGNHRPLPSAGNPPFNSDSVLLSMRDTGNEGPAYSSWEIERPLCQSQQRLIVSKLLDKFFRRKICIWPEKEKGTKPSILVFQLTAKLGHNFSSLQEKRDAIRSRCIRCIASCCPGIN